jgi:hypothetical protein
MAPHARKSPAAIHPDTVVSPDIFYVTTFVDLASRGGDEAPAQPTMPTSSIGYVRLLSKDDSKEKHYNEVLDKAGPLKDVTLMTAVSASAGAVSSYMGHALPSSVPMASSLVTFIGGFCGRWLTIHKNTGHSHHFAYAFVSIVFFILGTLLMLRGMSCAMIKAQIVASNVTNVAAYNYGCVLDGYVFQSGPLGAASVANDGPDSFAALSFFVLLLDCVMLLLVMSLSYNMYTSRMSALYTRVADYY